MSCIATDSFYSIFLQLNFQIKPRTGDYRANAVTLSKFGSSEELLQSQAEVQSLSVHIFNVTKYDSCFKPAGVWQVGNVNIQQKEKSGKIKFGL